MARLHFLIFSFLLACPAFSQLNLTAQQAREDLGRYLAKAGMYQGVVGNDLVLKNCDELETRAGDGENKNFFIEVNEEKKKGRLVALARAYIKDKSGDKIYCSDILQTPPVVKSDSVRPRHEICRHLGCALTHFSAPQIYDPEVVATIKATCPTYSGVLSADENISAFRQELENVDELCRDISEKADVVNISDRDFAKLPNTHGAASAHSSTEKSKQQ